MSTHKIATLQNGTTWFVKHIDEDAVDAAGNYVGEPLLTNDAIEALTMDEANAHHWAEVLGFKAV